MKLLDQYLEVKISSMPKSGKGLFTKVFIPKGSLITEYKGKISTWKDADHDDGKNPYIYYLNKDHVIDAKGYLNSFAHFANDAKGHKTVRGIVNNSKYIVKGKKVFIEAIKDIQPGEEIFVGYGKTYWDVIRKNKIM